MVHDELKKLGITVDVVAMGSRAVIQAFGTAKYEVIWVNADKTDLDPGTNPDCWFSSGGAHMWNLENKTPATEWEKIIDAASHIRVFADFPWLLSPAAAMLLVVLGVNLVLQQGRPQRPALRLGVTLTR